MVAFPHETYPIFIGRRKSIRAVDAAGVPKTPISLTANTPILLVAQQDERIAKPTPADMYQVGTLGVIVEHRRLPDGTVRIMVEGKKRAKVGRFVLHQKFFKAEAEELAETTGGSAALETLMRSVLSAFDSYARGKEISPEIASSIGGIGDPSILSDKMAGHLQIAIFEKQALLETINPVERLEKILGYLEAAN